MNKGEHSPTKKERQGLEDAGAKVEIRDDGELFVGGVPVPLEMIGRLKPMDTRKNLGSGVLEKLFRKS